MAEFYGVKYYITIPTLSNGEKLIIIKYNLDITNNSYVGYISCDIENNYIYNINRYEKNGSIYSSNATEICIKITGETTESFSQPKYIYL